MSLGRDIMVQCVCSQKWEPTDLPRGRCVLAIWRGRKSYWMGFLSTNGWTFPRWTGRRRVLLA